MWPVARKHDIATYARNDAERGVKTFPQFRDRYNYKHHEEYAYYLKQVAAASVA